MENYLAWVAAAAVLLLLTGTLATSTTRDAKHRELTRRLARLERAVHLRYPN